MQQKEKRITVVKVEPGKPAEMCQLENTLEGLQAAIASEDGIYKCIDLLCIEEGVCLLLNDEGKLIQMPPNRRLGDYDIICGTFYVVGSNDETGDLCSLTDQQMEKYLETYKEPEDIDPSEVTIEFKFIPFNFMF